jgi:predicted membrane-bound spermidine synthase
VRPGLAAAIVALSGATSLVYQVVWERTLRYSLGGDSVSAAVVSGTFLLGLGLGAALFARWRADALRVYALVEASIGLYGLASFHLLAPLARVLGELFPASVAAAGDIRPVVVLASVLFLLPPTILIGGTGPLMYNAFVRPGAYPARRVGALYALNTAGAAAGVLAAPFVFLNHWSLPSTLAIVAVGNFAVAGILWRAARRGPAGPPPDPAALPAPAAPPPAGVGRRGALALAAAAGALALAFEVCVVRALFVLNPSSPYNFPAMLVAVLLAIAAGSALATRAGADDPARGLARVGVLFAGSGLALLAAVAASAALSLAGYRVRTLPEAAGSLAVIVHAALLGGSLPAWLGGVLPLLLRLSAPTGRALPGTTGRLYLANAVGAFGGALLTQFAGFPTVGSRGVLIGLYWAALAIGGLCLWRAGPAAPRRWLALAALPLLAAGPVLLPAPLWRVYVTGVTDPGATAVEGVTGVATIEWRGDSGEVRVNGQTMSSLPDHPRHVRLVAFALALPVRDRVLLLGLGGGGMVRNLVHDPAVLRLDVVDWSHELPRLLGEPRARRLLDDALASPRVTVRRADARVATALYPAASFDVVIDNLAIANWVGSTGIKSVEYFRQLRRILTPGGVLVYNGNWAGARRPILAALTEVFADVRLHPGRDSVEELVVAGARPPAYDGEHVAEVLAALRETGLHSPEELIDGLVPVTRGDLGRTRPVRDAYLRYEYTRDPWRDFRRAVRDLWR